MLLNELELIKLGKTNLLITLSKDWKYNIDDIKDIGTIQNYKLRMGKYRGYALVNSSVICIYDTINKKNAGFISLTKFGKAYEINGAVVDKEYLGMGLITKIYAYLILKLNFILWSKESQTIGGRAIWEKLIKVKGINVFAWDKVKRKAHSLDKNDPFENDVEVYSNEVPHIKLMDVNNQRIKVKLLFDDLTKLYTNKNLSDEQKKLAIKLDKEWKESKKALKKLEYQYKEYRQLSFNMTLVACRER
jgi:hypothetical protein